MLLLEQTKSRKTCVTNAAAALAAMFHTRCSSSTTVHCQAHRALTSDNSLAALTAALTTGEIVLGTPTYHRHDEKA